ncbi:CPBP family intramembrane metalloprotease [Leuconostoc citreum]|uniref:CPBP family intramembrane glutamic endopeptidase n=1 Tax=Leuconostoc citreum TaxID=33964 RepID=UPI00200AD2FF|nr:CPBP family intramembrane glutamic endopeptidase [Leuconostoc citreum]MCK8606456.1 CPBP family intramembrane metalloprotease [Leuconostoc citreum]
MKNKNFNGILYGLALFIIFMIIDSSVATMKFPHHELIYATARFLFSLFVVYVFFKTMKTDKLFKYRLKLNNYNRFFIILLVLICLGLYFIINRGLNQIIDIFSKDIFTITSTLLLALSAGIFEEYLTRGFFFQSFFNIFKKNKLIMSSLLSSFLFGFLHIYNIFNKGLTPTLQQVFYATAFGLLLAALRISLNGLLLNVGLHTLVDFQLNLLSSVSPQNNTPWVGILVVFIPIALISFLAILSLNKEMKLISRF